VSALLWKYAAFLVFLFSLGIGATRLLPVEEVSLHSFQQLFLSSPTCPRSPCLLGIQPLSTTLDQALEALGQHPWIDYVHLDKDMSRPEVRITWNWNGQQPDYVDNRYAGILNARFFPGPQERLVTNLSVSTHFRFEDLRSLLPEAESGGWHRVNFVNYHLIYPYSAHNTHTSIVAQVPCPLWPMHYWNARVRITQGMGSLFGLARTAASLDDLLQIC
jgi:hypothetical protein